MTFWQTKQLNEMSVEEWELLCDGCGKCCLQKLEDKQTGEVVYTQIACELLNIKTCRCNNYSQRKELIADCLKLRENFVEFSWLPQTCAYRLLHEGKPLFNWHPLVSKKTDSVQKAGISVSSYAMPAQKKMKLEEYIIRGIN
jgi:uncharacterized cysteine cluster protein YcgN (CxxCxxCC family)